MKRIRLKVWSMRNRRPHIQFDVPSSPHSADFDAYLYHHIIVFGEIHKVGMSARYDSRGIVSIGLADFHIEFSQSVFRLKAWSMRASDHRGYHERRARICCLIIQPL